MATIKLKSNIMDLICRTCLKINKNHFNMFELTQKYIPDLIMECSTVEVRKDDGFPVNICSSCLEKLNLACDFKAMIIESDTKLRNFYYNKTLKNNSQNNDVSNVVMIVKAEMPVVKSEKLDPLIDLNNSSDASSCDKNIRNKIIAKENIVNTNDVVQRIPVIIRNNAPESEGDTKQIESVKCNKTISSSCNRKETFQENEEEVTKKNVVKNSLSIKKCTSESIKNIEAEAVEHDLSHESSDNFDESPEDLKESLKVKKRRKNKRIKVDESKVVETDLSDESSYDFDESSNDSGSSFEDSVEAYDNTSCDNKGSAQIAVPINTEQQVRANLVEENKDDKFPDDFYDILGKENTQSGLSLRKMAKNIVYCKPCKKTFKYMYFMKVHIKQHIGKTPYKCDVCGKSFTHQSSLNVHKQRHENNRKYSCEICGKTFKFLSNVLLHKVTHSEERPYKCTSCDKAFKLKSVLTIHMLKHENVKKHVCELCGRAFFDLGALNNHKPVHNTTKDFICLICGKAFSEKRLLREHIQRHTTEKRFACSDCDKRFHSKQLLRNHKVVHTGEKPFSCRICSKAFGQRSTLRYHMRIHTGESPYSCSICSSKFKFSHHLQSHMKVHKKDVSQE